MLSRWNLLLAMVFCASSYSGALKDQVDRFTGERTVKWSTLPSGPEKFSLGTLATFSSSGAEQGYILFLTTYSSRPQYSGCSRVYWLFDGKPAPDLVNDYEVSAGNDAVIEHFRLNVSRADVQRFASAKRIEFKVCNTESEISQDDLNGLREVLKATQ